MIVVVILCALLPRPSRAAVTDLAEQLAGLLQKIPKAPGARNQDKERRIVLNGQPLRLVTGRTFDGVRPTIEFYRQRFEDQAQSPKLGLKLLGMQDISDRAGTLVMIDPESREVLRAVADRKRDFLSAGPLRMAVAHRRGDGTDYLVLWSDAPLHGGLLNPPRDHDAPGQDAPQVPRPPGSVRSLNLYEPAAGYGLVNYLLETPPEEALRSAKENLRAAGFFEDPGFVSAAAEVAPGLVQLQKQKNTVLLRARPDKSNHTEVTYLVHAQ